MSRYDHRPGIRILVLTLAAALLAGALPAWAQAQEIVGTWESRYDRDNRWGRSVYLSLEVRRGGDGRSQNGFTLRQDQLAGVTTAQLEGSAEDLAFRLEREAGTLTFEGDVRDGLGWGRFAFQPAAGYARQMADLGYPGLSSERIYLFALQNVTTTMVRELQALGYQGLSEKELTSFAIHGVSPEFIREMNALGYANIAAKTLVNLRIHGVSPDWVRSVRSAMGS